MNLDDDRKLIFVVEDDPGMRKSIARLLYSLGFSAELYPSAEAFLLTSKYSQTRDSCIILDIHLEGMSGMELATQLAGSGHALPVIFITGNDNEWVRRAALQQNCVAYLTKPFTAKALSDAIDLALA